MPIDPEFYHPADRHPWRDRDPWDPPAPKQRPRPRQVPPYRQSPAPQQAPTPQQPPEAHRETTEPPGGPPAGQTPPPQLTPPPRPPHKGRGTVALVIIVFLVLLVGVTVALFLAGDGRSTIGGRQEFRLPEPYDTEEEADEPTTVARAPVGSGVTIHISPEPGGEPLTFQAIYQKEIPSIVSIRAKKSAEESLGTGVIATADGYIITNDHVISGSSKVTVTLLDDTVYPALLVGTDSENDLAVLKIDASSLTPAEFGDSSALRVGDVALAIGNPLGEELRGTMTSGIISAINRDMTVDGTSMVLIQTTAALNSGNSGGALLNQYGQVIGITNMKMSSYYDTIEGLGFAIPTTTVKVVADELIAIGHIDGRPTIGITVRALTEEAAAQYDAPAGLRIEVVEEHSDASAKGIQVGDVIVEAEGQPVQSGDELNAIKEGLQAGDSIELRLYRDGVYLNISVELVERYMLDG